MTLTLVPIGFRDACQFVAIHHRHHGPPRGAKFCIGAAHDDELVGVIIGGRPIARAYDDGLTLEVTRCCIREGFPNAASLLYGAAWRATKAIGYRRLVTYTQTGETGASLRAAGYRVVAERPARESWAASSVKLRHLRNPVGAGGVARTLWEAM